MPALLVLRLKVADEKVAQVETQVTRTQKEGALFRDRLTSDRQAPLCRQRSREIPARCLATQAINALRMFYPAGLEIGSFVTVDAPFRSDAYRSKMACARRAAGCARTGCEDMKTQTIMEHPGITSRVAAVDEDLGIVLLA